MASLNVPQKKERTPRLVELTPDKSYVMPWPRVSACFACQLVCVSRRAGFAPEGRRNHRIIGENLPTIIGYRRKCNREEGIFDRSSGNAGISFADFFVKRSGRIGCRFSKINREREKNMNR